MKDKNFLPLKFLESMGDKPPGPNRFTMVALQECWEIVN